MCIWEADYVEDVPVKSKTISFQFDSFQFECENDHDANHDAWHIALEKSLQYANEHPSNILTKIRMIAI